MAARPGDPGTRDDQWIVGEIVAPDAARFDTTDDRVVVR